MRLFLRVFAEHVSVCVCVVADHKDSAVISKNYIATLFSNIATICSFNNKFLGDLAWRLSEWNDDDPVCIYSVSVFCLCLRCCLWLFVAENAMCWRSVLAIRTVHENVHAGEHIHARVNSSLLFVVQYVNNNNQSLQLMKKLAKDEKWVKYEKKCLQVCVRAYVSACA